MRWFEWFAAKRKFCRIHAQRVPRQNLHDCFLFRGKPGRKSTELFVTHTYNQTRPWSGLLHRVWSQLWVWKDNKSFRLRWQPFYTVHLNARYKELVPYSRQVPSSVPTFLVFILTQADKRQTTHLAKSVYRKQRIIKKSDHCCVLKAKNKKFRSLLCTENKE